MKKIVSTLLVLALALGLCSAAMADTVKIGGIAPLTGAVSVYGLLVKDGVDLYVEEVNANGASYWANRWKSPGWTILATRWKPPMPITNWLLAEFAPSSAR